MMRLERSGTVRVSIGTAAAVIVTGAVTPEATVTSAVLQTLCIVDRKKKKNNN